MFFFKLHRYSFALRNFALSSAKSEAVLYIHKHEQRETHQRLNQNHLSMIHGNAHSSVMGKLHLSEGISRKPDLTAMTVGRKSFLELIFDV